MQLILASKKRQAAKASPFSKRSRKASAKKAKEVAEPVETPPKYLQPTPKLKASSADTKDKAPKRRRKSKAGNKGLPSAEFKPVKSELDYNPLEEEADYVANAKKVKAEASPESPESEEEDSQEPEQEVTEEKLTEQFNRLKASVKPEEKPSAAAVKRAGRLADVEETGNQPVRSHGNIGRLQETLVAILKLGSPCQGLPVLEDRLQSNRLPGDKVIIHGNRHAIELKILMHRQGHKLRLLQGDEEVEDDFRLKTLSDKIWLHVLEEPLPRGGHIPHLQYTINQSVVGTALAGDPHVPCVLSPNTPRFVSCLHPEAQHSVVVLDLEGTPLVCPEPRGARIEQIRSAFRVGPDVTMTGLCGCKRHFVQVDDGAFVPCGATLVQWTRP